MTYRTNRSSRSRPSPALVSGAALALLIAAGTARAGDVTWDNGSSDLLWNLSSLNWSGAAWNNAAGDGAVFPGSGTGTVMLPGPITARSADFQTNGYILAGPGPLSFTSTGTGTLGAGVVNVAAGVVATCNAPISGAVGVQKTGDGTFELGGTNSMSGLIPLAGSTPVAANVVVGDANAISTGGIVRLLSSTTLPPSAVVGVTSGTLDLGANDVTLGGLVLRSPMANAVIGSGTLRVNGEIHVLGDFDSPSGNIIATNVDLGGGTQVVRVGSGTFFNISGLTCLFTGTLSNGSLLKSFGYMNTGTLTSTDSLGLWGNNTYTGPTILNAGSTTVTGTNATASVVMSGSVGGGGGSLTLMGPSGSLGSATSIQVIGGGRLVLDNNTSFGASSNPLIPSIFAGQNNDRIRDDAAITLRDSSFALTGLAATAASETFGSLTVTGGQNTVTVTPTTPASGGTATLVCAGNLAMANRATLSVTSPSAAPLGGAAARVFVNGTVPAPDATGLLPRMICSSTGDFLTYSAATGLTPYTGYTTNSLATPGVNVALTAATATAGSLTINALKSTGSFTTTLTSGDVLTVGSGMVYSTSSTNTFAGGTLNFGNTPGVFWGTNTVNNTAAVSGSQGLIVGTGTLTLAGNLAGLSGPITVNSGTLTLTTPTFTGPIQVRSGTFNMNTTQTSLGTVTLGVPEQDPSLFGTVPTLSISGAGANAAFNANVVVDNGTQSFAGIPLGNSFMATLSPLSNSTGSQFMNGNITLNSPLNLQGGGGSGTGATRYAGTISGPSYLLLRNGRISFEATSVLSNAGGLVMGAGGNTGIVSMLGTSTSNGPITINGGNNTSLTYAGAGSLYGGPITIQNASGTQAPSLIPLSTSTISNAINLNGDLVANVGAGLTATWAGPLTGTGALNKNTGTGTLLLTNASSTYSGATNVNAGTLSVNGVLPGASATVGASGTLSGSGTLGGAVTVNGILAPGNSVGTINTGNLNLAGALACDVDAGNSAADLVNVTGTVTLGAASALNVSVTGNPTGQVIIVKNDGADAVSGVFGSVTGLPAGATISYAFSGTDSLGRVGDGNDIAIVFTQPCYANCDNSSQPPVLNVADFTCFLQKYAAGDLYANCDNSSQPPILNVADFTCFLQKYAVGCQR